MDVMLATSSTACGIMGSYSPPAAVEDFLSPSSPPELIDVSVGDETGEDEMKTLEMCL